MLSPKKTSIFLILSPKIILFFVASESAGIKKNLEKSFGGNISSLPNIENPNIPETSLVNTCIFNGSVEGSQYSSLSTSSILLSVVATSTVLLLAIALSLSFSNVSFIAINLCLSPSSSTIHPGGMLSSKQLSGFLHIQLFASVVNSPAPNHVAMVAGILEFAPLKESSSFSALLFIICRTF